MKYRGLFLTTTMLAVVSLYGLPSKTSIKVPKGFRVLDRVEGKGVQIYVCKETPTGRNWELKGPDAKLLDKHGTVIGAHSAGPTWTLNDGGSVQGMKVAAQTYPGSVDWLLLRAKPDTGSGSLAAVAFIQRTKTHGGLAGAGCQDAADLERTVEIPYSATYTFYVPK